MWAIILVFVAFLPAYLRFSSDPNDHPMTTTNLRPCYKFRSTKIMEIQSTFDHHLGKRLCCHPTTDCETTMCTFQDQGQYFLSIDSMCYTPLIDGIFLVLLIFGVIISTIALYLITRE